MAKRVLFLIILMLAFPAYARPPECDFDAFPSFWADAQAIVEKLELLMKESEKDHLFSATTTDSFRDSLRVCEAKRKALFPESVGAGSGGMLTQLKCETALICSRIAVLDPSF